MGKKRTKTPLQTEGPHSRANSLYLQAYQQYTCANYLDAHILLDESLRLNPRHVAATGLRQRISNLVPREPNQIEPRQSPLQQRADSNEQSRAAACRPTPRARLPWTFENLIELDRLNRLSITNSPASPGEDRRGEVMEQDPLHGRFQ